MELEAFRAELNQPTIKPAFETRQTATEQQPASDKLVHHPGEITEFGEIATVDKLASIIESLLSKGDNRPAVAIADKLLLTIALGTAANGIVSKNFSGMRLQQGS